jgi:hypothetical protein
VTLIDYCQKRSDIMSSLIRTGVLLLTLVLIYFSLAMSYPAAAAATGASAAAFRYRGNAGSSTAEVEETEFFRTLRRIYCFDSGLFPYLKPTGITNAYNLYGDADNTLPTFDYPNGTGAHEALQAIYFNKKDVLAYSKKYHIQPQLLGGIVFAEVGAGGVPILNTASRVGSIVKYTSGLFGKKESDHFTGDLGITKVHQIAMDRTMSVRALYDRLKWSSRRDWDDRKSIQEAAAKLAHLARRRYGKLSSNLTPYQMAIVATEYNAGEKTVTDHPRYNKEGRALLAGLGANPEGRYTPETPYRDVVEIGLFGSDELVNWTGTTTTCLTPFYLWYLHPFHLQQPRRPLRFWRRLSCATVLLVGLSYLLRRRRLSSVTNSSIPAHHQDDSAVLGPRGASPRSLRRSEFLNKKQVKSAVDGSFWRGFFRASLPYALCTFVVSMQSLEWCHYSCVSFGVAWALQAPIYLGPIVAASIYAWRVPRIRKTMIGAIVGMMGGFILEIISMCLVA